MDGLRSATNVLLQAASARSVPAQVEAERRRSQLARPRRGLTAALMLSAWFSSLWTGWWLYAAARTSTPITSENWHRWVVVLLAFACLGGHSVTALLAAHDRLERGNRRRKLFIALSTGALATPAWALLRFNNEYVTVPTLVTGLLCLALAVLTPREP